MVTIDFITDNKDYLNNFNSRHYKEAFEHFRGRLQEAMDGMNEAEVDSNIDNLIEQVSEKLASLKKWKQNSTATDYRVLIALYMIPSATDINSEISNYFANSFIEKWNAKFPEPPIKASTFEDINAGFSKSLSDIFGIKSIGAKK